MIASPITSVTASGCPSIVRAATQLVSTIIAPTDEVDAAGDDDHRLANGEEGEAAGRS